MIGNDAPAGAEEHFSFPWEKAAASTHSNFKDNTFAASAMSTKTTKTTARRRRQTPLKPPPCLITSAAAGTAYGFKGDHGRLLKKEVDVDPFFAAYVKCTENDCSGEKKKGGGGGWLVRKLGGGGAGLGLSCRSISSYRGVREGAIIRLPARLPSP